MRIVAGEFKGRRLAVPSDRRIRPTTDRTREAVFNMLAHSRPALFDGARVIDLFAGTGAVGIEALSRGCRFCLFVDTETQARVLQRNNVEALGLTGRTKIWRRDATALGDRRNMPPFDVVFADPPYGRGLAERAAAALLEGDWLAGDALLVVEERADALPTALPGYDRCDARTLGDTGVATFRRLAT